MARTRNGRAVERGLGALTSGMEKLGDKLDEHIDYRGRLVDDVARCEKQAATQRELFEKHEAKKPGGFQARQFWKTVEKWEAKAEEARAALATWDAEHPPAASS